MKNIVILLLTLLTAITHTTAQDRIYDLELTLISPDDQATLKRNEPFDLEFYFKNLGPDSIMSTDTLLLQYSGMTSPQAYPVGKTLNPHTDTLHFKTTITPSDTVANPVNFCVIGQIKTTIDKDDDFTNNSQCSMLHFEEEPTTGIPDLLSGAPHVSTLEIYPNPATDIVHLNYKANAEENTTLAITDMSGRKLIHTNLGTKNTGTITTDVSTLPPGLYLIEITGHHSKSINKLLIQR